MYTPKTRPLSRDEAIGTGILTGAGVSFLLKSKYLGHQVQRLYPVINANVPTNNTLALFLIGAAPAFVHDRVQKTFSTFLDNTRGSRYLSPKFKRNTTRAVSVASAIATSVFVGYGFDQSARTSFLTSALGALIFYAIKSAIHFRETKEKNKSQSPQSLLRSSSSSTTESTFASSSPHPLNNNSEQGTPSKSRSDVITFTLSPGSSAVVSFADEPDSPSSPISHSPRNDTGIKSPTRQPLSVSVGSPESSINDLTTATTKASPSPKQSPSLKRENNTDATSDASLVPDASASTSSVASSLSAPLNNTPLLVPTPPQATPETSSTKIELTDIDTKLFDNQILGLLEDDAETNETETQTNASQVDAEEQDESTFVSADVDTEVVKVSGDEKKSKVKKVNVKIKGSNKKRNRSGKNNTNV